MRQTKPEQRCQERFRPILLHLDRVILSDYDSAVTVGELKRWLKKQGCSFAEGRKHTKVMLGARVTWMPRHQSRELKTKTMHTILKELGLGI